MKKILIILVAFSTLVFSGCKKWVDKVSANPNSPSTVTPALLLSTSEVAVFAIYHGQLSRTASIFMQQSAGTQFQMEEVANYTIKEDDNINEWKTIYADGLINMQTLIDQAGDANPRYRGIAKVLKCMTIGIATDYWGNVPYSQALHGLEGSAQWNPAYDAQDAVITAIQSELSSAIADLNQPSTSNTLMPGGDDFIHGGDPAAWIKTAYILKMRYANRLSQRAAGTSATDVIAAFNAAGLASGDNTFAIFGTSGNELNPWAAFNQTRANYIKMGGYFIDTLTNSDDPRLPFYAGLDDTGGITGTQLGDGDIATSNMGPLYGGDDASLPLATYSEALFILAEAKLRSGDAAGAATAFNDAVKESILRTTGASDPGYEATYASETGGSITLAKIMYQKYVDNFATPEVWADWRRTGFPALTPNPNSQLGGIPLRLPTPSDERLYNEHAESHNNLLEPVWWDN